MFSIVAGFAVMLTLVCAGIGFHAGQLAVVAAGLRWIGAAWLVVLAWKIATASPPGEGGRGRVLFFFGAAGFQWINPKGWLIAVAAAGEYRCRAVRLPFSLRASSLSSWWSGCPV